MARRMHEFPAPATFFFTRPSPSSIPRSAGYGQVDFNLDQPQPILHQDMSIPRRQREAVDDLEDGDDDVKDMSDEDQVVGRRRRAPDEVARDRAAEARMQDWHSRVRRGYRIGRDDSMSLGAKDTRHLILSFLGREDRARFASVNRQARDDVQRIESDPREREQKANDDLFNELTAHVSDLKAANAQSQLIMERALVRANRNPFTTSIRLPPGLSVIFLNRAATEALRALAPRITRLNWHRALPIFVVDGGQSDEITQSTMRLFTRVRQLCMLEWFLALSISTFDPTVRDFAVNSAGGLAYFTHHLPNVEYLFLQSAFQTADNNEPWVFLNAHPRCIKLSVSVDDFRSHYEAFKRDAFTHHLRSLSIRPSSGNNDAPVTAQMRNRMRNFVRRSPTLRELTLGFLPEGGRILKDDVLRAWAREDEPNLEAEDA